MFHRVVPALLFTGSILIFSLHSAFAQTSKIKLNEKAFAYARELIMQGHVIADKKNAWANHRPTAAEENQFIQTHTFADYAKWHLGIDETHAENVKARYKFPFGDFKNVHRSGLLAVRSRAHQFGYSDIENAAIELMEMIDPRKTERSSTKRRLSVGACCSGGL